jgi:arsenate reductase (glutaredoxin)
MLFICYPMCKTCQKAKKWLDDHGIIYEFRDIKKDKPTIAELQLWYKKSNLPLKRFWNTSGMQYRTQGLKDKIPTMTDEKQLEILATDGMLVKRPILIDDNIILVGFKEAEWKNKLDVPL